MSSKATQKHMKLNAEIEDLEMPEQRAEAKEMSLEKAARKQVKAMEDAGVEIDDEAIDDGIKAMQDNYQVNEVPEGEGITVQVPKGGDSGEVEDADPMESLMEGVEETEYPEGMDIKTEDSVVEAGQSWTEQGEVETPQAEISEDPMEELEVEASKMPKMGGFGDSEGDFQAAEEGTWDSQGADSMPGLEEAKNSNDPVPDMGEEINVKTELTNTPETDGQMPPIDDAEGAEEMPENMVDSKGKFKASKGEWRSSGADSMPGLGEDDGEPVPDMGEEVEEEGEIPSEKMQQVEGTPEAEPLKVPQHPGMTDASETTEGQMPPVNDAEGAEEMPENMADSKGKFTAAEEGEWKATGADSMPGLGEDDGEPVPDMGEEVEEDQEIPSEKMQQVDGTPEAEPINVPRHPAMTEEEESKQGENEPSAAEIEKMLNEAGLEQDDPNFQADYIPGLSQPPGLENSEGAPELAATKYLGGDMGVYWIASIFVFLAGFMFYRRATRNKKPVKEGKTSLI